MGWVTKPLGDVCTFERGLTYSKADEVAHSANGVLRANNIALKTKSLDLTDIRYISDTITVPAIKKVRKGSLLICTASGSRSHLGKVALIDDNYDLAFGGFMGLITPHADADSQFLYYLLAGDSFKEKLASLASGTNINNLRFKDIADFPVSLPPLKEQRRIVGLLDKTFAAISTATTNAEKNLTNARELLLGYLNSQLSECGSARWRWAPLGEVCEVLDRLRRPVTKADRRPGDYPYYGATGIVDWIDGYIFDEPLVLLGEDGAKWGPGERSAFSASGKYWVNNHAHIMRPNRNVIRDDWLIYYLNMADLMPYITGVTVPKLNQERMRSILIPLPPLETQHELVLRMDALSERVAELMVLNTDKLAQLAALKQSLLYLAFAGELDVQEPLAA